MARKLKKNPKLIKDKARKAGKALKVESPAQWTQCGNANAINYCVAEWSDTRLKGVRREMARGEEKRTLEIINPFGNLWCVELKMKYNKMLYMQLQCKQDAASKREAYRIDRGWVRERKKVKDKDGGYKNKGHTEVTIIKFINVEQFCISCPKAKKMM